MNQPQHRLMTDCHLCILSPFIRAPYNISHTKRLPGSHAVQRTLNQMHVKCSNANQNAYALFPLLLINSASASQDSLSKFALCPSHTKLQPLVSLPVQVVSVLVTLERCTGVGWRGTAGVCVCVRASVHTCAWVVKCLHFSGGRHVLLHPSCGHLGPIKSH